ncbi:hypothetical protein ACFS27_10535 [Promicromonospora vindobonensis]|uniref:Mce-associated membrane protein n=1 Tax=Promicromonospora vindobonensis TaxID=195748 RepID=A0ABW5VQU1_9MICO
MVSSAITPTRTIVVLIGVAVIALAGFAVVRSGAFEPETVQGAMPGPGSSSPSVSASPSESPTALPSPTPTASPEPTTPAQIKAKNVADAKARLVEYYETTAVVANGGYRDWDTTLDQFYGNPRIWSSISGVYAGLEEEGQYTTGAAMVDGLEVTGYVPDDAGFESVNLRACVDFTRVSNFSSDGTALARDEGAPTRYKFDYLMRHQGPGSVWTVNEQVPHPEQAC